jgi:archaellum biogenesis protein FlaJ (TadC family)
VFVQVGGITATQIYVAKDAPLYKTGNHRLLYINILSLFLFFFAKGYYVFRNKQRDKKWNALTKEVSSNNQIKLCAQR